MRPREIMQSAKSLMIASQGACGNLNTSLCPGPSNGRILKTAHVWGSQTGLGRMSGGKVCPHRFPAHTSLRKLGLHSRTHSPAIFHLDVARDVQATSIQCPPECLKKSRFSSNSRNCMGLFIPVTEHRRDIIFSRDFSSNHSPLPVLSPPTSFLPPLS